jgi:hypothetical protein
MTGMQGLKDVLRNNKVRFDMTGDLLLVLESAYAEAFYVLFHVSDRKMRIRLDHQARSGLHCRPRKDERDLHGIEMQAMSVPVPCR